MRRFGRGTVVVFVLDPHEAEAPIRTVKRLHLTDHAAPLADNREHAHPGQCCLVSPAACHALSLHAACYLDNWCVWPIP